jgi:hypothetical protein
LFNDDGSANGTAGFTFIKTSNLVTTTGNLSAANVIATANLYYNGNILVARSLTVGTRGDTPVTIPLIANGNIVILTRSGNTNVQVTT